MTTILIETLLLIASLRSSTDTLAPMDYLIGLEAKAKYKFIEAIFENEYERERGDNFYNLKSVLDIKYLRAEINQNQARNISTQKAIAKYPMSLQYKGIKYYSDLGLSSIWNEWDTYKGTAFFNRIGLKHKHFYFEYKSDVFLKKAISFESSHIKAGIPVKYIEASYKMDIYNGKPDFHWLLFKVRVK